MIYSFCSPLIPRYTIKLNPEVKDGFVFKGEPEILGSLDTQKRPYTQKNPFMAPIITRKELYKNTDRSCLHIELDVTGSGIRYVLSVTRLPRTVLPQSVVLLVNVGVIALVPGRD